MINRLYFILIIGGLILSGCQKKQVQLPLIDVPGISEIQNHSSIWIFLETNNGKTYAKLNKNNKILNTHWIFNIDRGLSMNQVIPLLQKMQENRNKDSMHKKEGMKNYFSYADTAAEKISLSPFSQTTFLMISRDGEEELPESCTVILEIFGDRIKLNNEVLALNSLEEMLQESDLCDPGKDLKILLAYDGETSFQDYLTTKVFLQANELSTSSVEYVYTVK